MRYKLCSKHSSKAKNKSYENNNFANCADQFYLKTVYSFNVFMVSSTFLLSYCQNMF